MSDHWSTIQSLVNFRNSQGETARGTLLKLSRSTVVFEVYNPYSIVQLSEVLDEMTLRRGDRVVYNGRAVVSNLVNTGLMLIVSVTLVDPWSDLSGLFEETTGIGAEVDRFISDWEANSNIIPGYRLAVSQLRSFLSELVRWTEQIDMDASQPVDPNHPLSQDVFEEIAHPLIPRINELFLNFEEQASAVPEQQINFHKSFAQRDLHPLLLRSPFVHRSFTKPLGYAGDYEMVNMLLRDPREGPTTYSHLINTFSVESAVCRAHRNRIEILTKTLISTAQQVGEKKQAKVLNVGCGPAQEILRFIRQEPLSKRCHLSLLDFNEPTLAETQRTINAAMAESNNKPEIELIHDSVHSLLKQAARPSSDGQHQSYDLIYCAGLFDYLSDRVCSRLIRLFTSWCNPGGLVLTTNVHPNNPNRGAMEHLQDWYLIYRDEDHMLGLTQTQHPTQAYVDSSGYNVFLEIRPQTLKG